MKNLDIGNAASIILPDGAVWKFDGNNQTLQISISDGKADIYIRFLGRGPNATPLNQRLQYCHERIMEFINNHVYVPKTANVEEIESETWSGYQAVGGLGNAQFQVCRVITGHSAYKILLIYFEIDKEGVAPPLFEVLENIKIKPDQG